MKGLTVSDQHHCHARGCRKVTKPEMLMCFAHWKMVSPELQKAVWANYRTGQCDDKKPSEAWHKAADAAINAVAVKEGRVINVKVGRNGLVE